MANVRIDPPRLTNQDIWRFWARVDKSPGHGPKGDCWKWTKGTQRGGYGAFHVGRGPSRKCSAHRLVILIETGYWPTLNICHSCDWPPCCNPAHLFEGTQTENMQDAKFKGRTTQGERHANSRLTNEQVLAIRALYACRDRSLRDIGDIFGITASAVFLIVKRDEWGHI